MTWRRSADVVAAIWVRELRAYFLTPLAYVFLATFLLAAGAFTFEVGGFIESGRADLSAFFVFHPWLYLVFLPAIAMRLWADEYREGGIELLLTLPAPVGALVTGKFLAAWTVAAAALLLTLPLWASAAWLGEPDHAAIALGYFMSLLMAGAYLAIGCAMSAATGSQVAAFVLATAIGFVFTVAGTPLVLKGAGELLGTRVAEGLAAFALPSHFESAQRGVLEARALVYYGGLIALFLFLGGLFVDARRSR